MDQKEGWTDGKKRGLDRWTTRRIGGLMDRKEDWTDRQERLRVGLIDRKYGWTDRQKIGLD